MIEKAQATSSYHFNVTTDGFIEMTVNGPDGNPVISLYLTNEEAVQVSANLVTMCGLLQHAERMGAINVCDA